MIDKELRMPSAASGRRLVIALNNPRARYKGGKRAPIQIRIGVEVEKLDDRQLKLVARIERLMMRIVSPPKGGQTP